MEDFEFYIDEGSIIKITPNFERAKSVIRDSEDRIKDSDLLDVNRFPKFIFENYYDAVRDLLDAILLMDGYKSYSHEAPIAYLSKKGFDITIIRRLDNFRFLRHGSKYYGRKISIEEAKDIKKFYLEIKGKLYKVLNKIKELE